MQVYSPMRYTRSSEKCRHVRCRAGLMDDRSALFIPVRCCPTESNRPEPLSDVVAHPLCHVESVDVPCKPSRTELVQRIYCSQTCEARDKSKILQAHTTVLQLSQALIRAYWIHLFTAWPMGRPGEATQSDLLAMRMVGGGRQRQAGESCVRPGARDRKCGPSRGGLSSPKPTVVKTVVTK